MECSLDAWRLQTELATHMPLRRRGEEDRPIHVHGWPFSVDGGVGLARRSAAVGAVAVAERGLSCGGNAQGKGEQPEPSRPRLSRCPPAFRALSPQLCQRVCVC
jgi:hypothetical protein